LKARSTLSRISGLFLSHHFLISMRKGGLQREQE
jgi:hypothetical protein